jgi:GWxTD domain-containing protein
MPKRNLSATALVLLLLMMILPSASQGAADEKKQNSDKQKRISQEERQKERYKKWLEEDVYYLITPEEKNVFLKLTTDEEREQFIEQFWRRRDPDPKTPYNEFKEEHYRRIVYANENFTSGIPGWKTDRGMVYIKFGPPDHIEDYVYGAGYDRPSWEGLGKTKVFPTQFWEYRYIEGIGSDVELEFVDSGGGNLYTLTTDPNTKDLLLHADTQGKTLAEQTEDAWRIDRVVNRHDAGSRDDRFTHERIKDQPFNKYELLASISKPPEIKYKDLKSIVDTRIYYNLLPFVVRADYIKISEQQVLVPVTLQIPTDEITFKDRKFGMISGEVNFYGIVTTMSGRFVQEFEDQIIRDMKQEALEEEKKIPSRYQKFLLLPTGIYKLGLVVKDVNSGRIGSLEIKLNVPSYQRDTLNGSSLILTRRITRVENSGNDIGPFVLGDLKLVPDLDHRFQATDPLLMYMQVYNMTIDQNRLKPDVRVEYIAELDGQPFYRYQDLTGDTYQFISGDRLVITGGLPLKKFVPGKYTLRIRVHDNISGADLERVEKFEVVS